jgi:hypothetical protein
MNPVVCRSPTAALPCISSTSTGGPLLRNGTVKETAVLLGMTGQENVLDGSIKVDYLRKAFPTSVCDVPR